MHAQGSHNLRQHQRGFRGCFWGVCVCSAPVANDDAYSTDEDTALTLAASAGVLSNDTDADNDTLTAELVDNADNGTLTLDSDGSFTYTPKANFHGTDTFTHKANDGTEYSGVATVTITVDRLNDAPTVAVSGGACLSDTSASGRLNLTVSDVDSPPNSLGLSATSSNTSLIPNANLVTGGSGANRTLALSAVPKNSGTAIITLTVSDGTNESTLSVTVKVGTQASETITGTSGADVIFGLGGACSTATAVPT